MSSSTVAGTAAIPASVGPDECERVLERLRTDAVVHFGDSDVHLTPGAVEERPFSYVVRVAIDASKRESRPRSHVYVKVFKPGPAGSSHKMSERVRRDFETTRRIHEAMAASDDMAAVRPVACYPEHLAIVTEEAHGHTLGALLERRARWYPGRRTMRELSDVLTTVGRWIRAFQQIDRRADLISLRELRSYVDVRLERLVREPLAAFTEADRFRVLEHLDALSRIVTPPDLEDVLVHADLAPGNVLVAGRTVTVLDFAMTHRGSRLQDLSRLHMQLDLMRAKPYFRTNAIRVLQQSLLGGFDPTLTDRRPAFRMLLLRHHVNHLATLSVRREQFPANLYNAHLRRLHRRWIERELASAGHHERVE